jgi:hypothetical protein
VEQPIKNHEADRRFLAAFINGLIGTPGKHVTLQRPDNIEPINMAILSPSAEKEDRAANKDDQ